VSTFEGQPIYSIADFQFVLHGLGRSRSGEVSSEDEVTRAAVVVRRGGESVEAVLELSGDWLRGDLSWRGSMWAMPPSPGLWVVGLDAEARRERGIASGRLGLEVRGVFREAVRRAGLRKGDVIVAYDGRDEEISAPKFHADLRLQYYRPGAVLRLDVLRRGKRVPLEVRF